MTIWVSLYLALLLLPGDFFGDVLEVEVVEVETEVVLEGVEVTVDVQDGIGGEVVAVGFGEGEAKVQLVDFRS